MLAKCAFSLMIFTIFTVDSQSFSVTNQTRFKREEECPEDTPFSLPSFQCKSGGCIPGDEECNGRSDCEDGSDETDHCKTIKCSRLLFTCGYGACVKKECECDGWVDCIDGSDEKTPSCNGTITQCKDNEFRCKSGQCIDSKYKCDGRAECDDFSDEIRETCFDKNCPGFLYKCKYGACAVAGAECNGILECFDGSDEDPTICGKTGPKPPQPASEDPQKQGKCFLPNHPEAGHWTIFGPGSYAPGQFVDPGTILKTECNKNYKLIGEKVLVCERGAWSSNVGYCSKICPPRLSTPTLTVTCIYKHGEVENCTEAVNGTLAQYKCQPLYEDLNLKRRPVHICSDGQWDQVKPNCQPICGQKSVQATELIINGETVKRGNYPWQVALYTKSDNVLQCGGSLISQRVALTAAHCITGEKGKLNPKEDYLIAVGKYFRKHNHEQDKDAQFSEIAEMFIPELYKGESLNFLGDIAILVSKVTFTLSKKVQPVCLDAGQNYNVQERKLGYVTGWGFTAENKNPSLVLKELKVPYVSIAECESKLPDDYEIFLTNDKMCAGYLEKGTSVCRGDSGGGLVFKHEDDDRYYVTGVVSLAPRSPFLVDGCDSQQYGLYTKVGTYINHFILPKLARYG